MHIPFSGWAWVNPTLDLTRSSHILNHSNHHQGSLISLSRGGLISHEVNPNHLQKIITQHIGTQGGPCAVAQEAGINSRGFYVGR